MSTTGITVLSLFDGLSGGRIALERAGISVSKYYASEIDKYAIAISAKNYPDTIQLGSVINLTDEQLLALGPIDILIGGSPCQGFSMAGKMNGSSTACGIDVVTLEQYLQLKANNFKFDGQSYLFWEYIRVLRTVQPKYFFLENVRITAKWLPMFNVEMGVEPIIINSGLVSAQNRMRFYWTNIQNILQPSNKCLTLNDILIERLAVSPTGICIVRGFNENSLCHHVGNATDINGNESIKRVYAGSGKAPTLTTMQGGHREPKVLVSMSDINGVYRKLTPLECERLQTLPDNYTEGVSNSQRYKMIGNGWTIDVIAHIFRNIE